MEAAKKLQQLAHRGLLDNHWGTAAAGAAEGSKCGAAAVLSVGMSAGVEGVGRDLRLQGERFRARQSGHRYGTTDKVDNRGDNGRGQGGQRVG
jgi:hypothetical protein